MRKEQIEEMAKLKAINEMKAVIRDKTESCKTCSFYLNGLCDNACELEEDNQKICTDLYTAGYRKQEWISVEERLPDKEGTYLTCTDKDKILMDVFCIYPSHGTKFGVGGNGKVTHWMPLPEAPKMKGGVEQ